MLKSDDLDERVVYLYNLAYVDENIVAVDVSREKVLQIMRNIVMASGLSLYDEIIANLVSDITSVELETIVGLMNKSLDQNDFPEFQGTNFLSNFTCAKDRLNITSAQTVLYEKLMRGKLVRRRLKRFRRYYADVSGYSVDSDQMVSYEESFVRGMAYLDSISTSPSIGDIEEAVMNAVVFDVPVELVVIKCARMAQYRDKDGRNRLDIITSTKPETRESIDGTRDYPGDKDFIDRIAMISEDLISFGVPVCPVILVADDDVANMYPNRELSVVPYKDVEAAGEKCRKYCSELGKEFSNRREFSRGVQVAMLTNVLSGTEYEGLKESVMKKLICYRRFGPVGDSYFEALIQDDVERYADRYINYEGEVSVHKVAGKVGVMFGLKYVSEVFENPVFLTSFNNTVQDLLALNIDYNGKVRSGDRKILYIDI